MKITFIDFINEKKLNTNQIIDLYQNFMRILKIHEEHFYYKNLISNNQNFKSELNDIFSKIGKVITEDLYNLIIKYENDLYNNSLMQSNYGSSLYDICDVIIEDPDTLNINRYIQDFSDKDVYISNEEDFNKEWKELDDDLDKDIKEEKEIQELIENAWDDAVEEFGEDGNKVLISVIDKLFEYKKLYPHLSKKLQEEIKDLEKYI